MRALKLPEGLPPLPPVPEGYDLWKYRGLRWKREYGSPVCYVMIASHWNIDRCADGGNLHYCEAVKRTQKKANPVKPRRESLTNQLATAIQSGRNNPSMDTARECMRILDNHNRAIRRKKGGK